MPWHACNDYSCGRWFKPCNSCRSTRIGAWARRFGGWVDRVALRLSKP